MPRKRGRHAAQSGMYGEQTFLSLLEASRYSMYKASKYDGSTPAAIEQYPVPHPFRPDSSRAGRNDVMLETGLQRIYCQVKNQNQGGTCDEKLSFSFDIARYALSDQPFDCYSLVLLGVWWPQMPGIIEWAKRKCSEFEMLAGGMRRTVTARVLVGPRDVASWLAEVPVKKKSVGLF